MKSFPVKEAGERCFIPGSVQSQAGWGSKEPGLVEGVPACAEVLEWDDPQGAFQPKPLHYSMLIQTILHPVSPESGTPCPKKLVFVI